MKQFALHIICWCCLLACAASAGELVSLCDFEHGKPAWGFSLGQEYPGARGTAELDREQKRNGMTATSLRINADFSKGGVYVAFDLPVANVDAGGLSFWVRTQDVSTLTLRLNDSTGQCHQARGIALAQTSAWQEVKLAVDRITGGEHWGGANDGKWHAPATHLSIGVDKGSLRDGKLAGIMWLGEAGAWLRKIPAPVVLKGYDETVLLDDFEAERLAWGLNLGEEFPGAHGSLQRDQNAAHGGKHSLHLTADFSKGGAYVGARRQFSSSAMPIRDVKVIRFWMKAENATAFNVGLLDSSGQFHQKKGVAAGAGNRNDWQEFSLAVSKIAGGEHWGGANDGRWHGPPREISLNVEKGELADSAKPASVWLDDVQLDALMPPVVIGQTTLGNVFGSTEHPSFTVTVPDTVNKIAWTASDFFGVIVAKGTQAAKGTIPLTFALDKKGYFTLAVTAFSGNEELETASASFAVLDDYDFGSLQNSPFGIGTHFAQWYNLEIVPLIARAGIKEIRDEVPWSDVEQQKGTFVFPEKYESYMNAVTQAKIGVHLGLDYGNKYYDSGNTPYNEEGYSGFARYAAEVAKHCTNIHTVEIWNEWNSPGFCRGPAGSKPDVYQALIDHAYDAIKKARPDMKVVGCSTTGLWWGGYKWLEQFFKQKDSLRPMDALSVHPYNCALAPEYLTESIATIKRMIKQSGHESPPPIWITEVGWPVNISATPGVAEQVYESGNENVSEEQQAIYLVRSYALLLAAGAERIHWYDFMNDGTDPKSGEHNFGLIRNPEDSRGRYAPKPAYAAYASMTRQLAGMEFVKAEQESEVLRSYLFHKDGHDVRTVWTLQPAAVLIRARAGAPVTVVDVMGNAREIVPVGGEVVLALPAGLPIYVNGSIAPVSTALHVTVNESVRVALGEKIEVPYTIENTSSIAATVTLNLDGTDFRVEANGNSTVRGVAQLPAASHEGLSAHTCRILFRDVTLDTRTVVVTAESALSVPDVPAFNSGNATMQVRMENLSRERQYLLTGIDWEAGDLKGHADFKLALPPMSTQQAIVPNVSLPLPPGVISALKLTLLFEGAENLVYRSSIAIRPQEKK